MILLFGKQLRTETFYQTASNSQMATGEIYKLNNILLGEFNTILSALTLRFETL